MRGSQTSQVKRGAHADDSIKGHNYLTLAICYGVVSALSLIPLAYAFYKYLDAGNGSEIEEKAESVETPDVVEEKGLKV